MLVFKMERLLTPTGLMLVVTDDDGRLRAADWESHETRMRRLLGLHYGIGGFELEATSTHSAGALALARYFEGEVGAVDAIVTATGGTAFQKSVWTALRAVPAGEVTSYGKLAASLGAPRSIRAVGGANGANPIAIVVPCHRVVGQNGSLTGYGGGLERKEWLLAHEKSLKFCGRTLT